MKLGRSIFRFVRSIGAIYIGNVVGVVVVGESVSFLYKVIVDVDGQLRAEARVLSKRPVVGFARAFYDPRMSNAFRPFSCGLLFVFAAALNTSVSADEGMWLFNAPPLKQLKEKYQFEPTQQWLEH